MAMPGTRGTAGAGFAVRGRALTRPRAGPRLATDLARRPETLSNARRRSVARFPLVVAFGADVRRRAVFLARVFATLRAFAFLAAVFFADFRAAFFAAFFFFFLGLVLIRIAVSLRRAERAIGDRACRRRRSGRHGWHGRIRRWRRGHLRHGHLRRGCLLCDRLPRRRFLLRCCFLRRYFLLLRSRLFRRRVALRTGFFLFLSRLLGFLFRFRFLRLASHDR